jgi:hypothetical protein
VVQLAQRAAVPLLAQITMPVLRLGDGLPVAIEMPRILAVPATPSYRAELWASVDGGDLVSVGTFSSAEHRGHLGASLPQTARDVGLHHLRLRARLTYAKSALPTETRDLPELVYAIYDPRTEARFDVRTYVESAKRVSARRLDGMLPDLPFAVWLQQIAETHGGKVEEAWRMAYCDEFSIEAALPPRTHDLCTVAYLAIEGAWAEVWLRTGRVELAATEVRWLSETPSYEGMRLHGPFAVEPADALSALSDLLGEPPAGWPSVDLSIAPEDIDVTRASDQIHVSAVIRNSGHANARNAYVDVTVSTGQNRGIRRGFVIDVPRGSSTQVEASLPLAAAYGVVAVLVMQISEHSPHDAWNPDPTPDDAVAFRIVNAGQAPRGYADWIRSQCGIVCRGF